ncbi:MULTISPECIES: hypothetical protein [Mycolicibacterium]|uniref:hypothetical protein n=1 Tax=Mycolicibacterium TaxID=1866885 RepID=UPI0002FB40BD|nr:MULTISPECIES: hypothetical protein [Mycolicibacterium]
MSLHDYVAAPDHLGASCRIDELRADIERYARLLLGYDAADRFFRKAPVSPKRSLWDPEPLASSPDIGRPRHQATSP